MIGINASLYAIDGDLSQMDENDLINYIEQINEFLIPTVQGA